MRIRSSAWMFAGILISALIGTLSGCTLDGIKQGIYENQGRKQCQDKSQGLDCDFGPKTYDVYKQEYEQLKRQKPTTPAKELTDTPGAEGIK